MKKGWTTISSVNGRITLKDIMDDKSQPFSSINVESRLTMRTYVNFE